MIGKILNLTEMTNDFSFTSHLTSIFSIFVTNFDLAFFFF